MPSTTPLEIAPGFYFDGKKGLRRVLSVERGRVVYERLHPVGMAVASHETSLSEFSRWAHSSLSKEEAEDKHLSLQAKSVRPSPAQVSGLEAAARSEVVRGKVLTSLIDKSLVHSPKRAGMSPELTELGKRVLGMAAVQA